MRRLFLSLLLICAVQCSAPPLHAASEVATFKLANDGGGAQAERVVSFGQVFRRGALSPKSRVDVTLNGVEAPAQLNAKALYPDGSVRHAVLSVRTPAMAGGATLEGVVSAKDGDAPANAAATPPALPDLRVSIEFKGGQGEGKTLKVDLADMAKSAARKDAPWLSGPLVREQRYYGDTLNGVQVVVDVWTPVVGPSRLDVIVHNDTAQNADISAQTYDASISLDGKTVFKAEGLEHGPYSTWHKAVYTDGKTPPRVIQDLDLLIAAGAIPRYAKIKPDDLAADKLRDASRNDARPLGSAGVTPYMPTTGGRADIGPLPTWAVFYLLDPSRKNEEMLLANADAAGSVPWHVRDTTTQAPISIDQYPGVWLDGRGEALPPVLARKYYLENTRWQPDDAHQPSLSYLPYLLTGSQYYRDELAMQAGYVLLATDPARRDHASGLLLGTQVRGLAWGLRTLATAAYALPSSDPRQAYFQSKLVGNLKEIVQYHVNGHDLDAAGELKGYMPGPYGVEGAVPPWQDDYLVMVLGWIDTMGYDDARTIMKWMTNFVAGRFTNGDRGYDPIYGTAYYIYVTNPDTGRPIDTWADAFKMTFDPVKQPVKSLDYPEWGGGYAALARGSLTSIVNATGSPQASKALDYVVANTPRMRGAYAKDPTFAIALTAAKGD